MKPMHQPDPRSPASGNHGNGKVKQPKKGK
jgi:hypothetical protein